MAARTGRDLVRARSSPPTMNVRVAFCAPIVPPETGASMNSWPLPWQTSESSRAHAGSTVLMERRQGGRSGGEGRRMQRRMSQTESTMPRSRPAVDEENILPLACKKTVTSKICVLHMFASRKHGDHCVHTLREFGRTARSCCSLLTECIDSICVYIKDVYSEF
eukprot:768548-Hanusia_phi.AAC.3